MSTDPTPQGLPLDRPRYLQETPDGWQGADHKEPPTTVRYEFEITDEHDQTMASGDAPTQEEAEREGRHYLSQCRQDGPCTLKLRRVEVLEVSSPAPPPAAADEPPLWRVMHLAFFRQDSPSQGYAAEILAVRDRLFPGGRPDVKGVSDDCASIWDELTAEAARAEAGE